MGKMLKGLSATIIAIIVVIVVIVAAVGIYYGMTLTHPSKTTIVFYAWWGPGDSGVPLKETITAFEQAYPQYVVTTESLPGGGGVNAVPAILSLIKAGKPPALFQTHLGPQMLSFVEQDPKGVSDYVNWTSYYYANLSGKVIPEVFQAGALNGVLLSMPVQVHTASVLYVNNQVLHHYGLPIPTTLSQLINETLQLVKDGFYNSTNAPWGISGAEGGWGALQLWESIFLALGGPKLYNEITYGTLNLSDPNVMQIINETNTIFKEFSQYNLPGWQTMTWEQMSAALSSGRIAFLVMGDWASEYLYDYSNNTIVYSPLPQYVNNPQAYPLIATPFPGTQNYVAIVVDSIGVTTATPPSIQKAAIKFVEFWISPQGGNEIWTKHKGEAYWVNMSTNYYGTAEQAYMYERLVNISKYPANWVYALADGGLFNGPFLSLDSALLNYQEGVYSSAQFVQALQNILNVEKQSWLTANSYGLGYLGFPGHPFGNYLPPWVNSTSGGSTVSSSTTSSMMLKSNGMESNSEFTDNILNQVLTALTSTAAIPTFRKISKIFNL